MRSYLAGLQDMQFKRGEDEIDGVKLHFLSVDPNVQGKAAFNQFVRRHVFDTFGIAVADLIEMIGSEVRIDFNPKGKIVGLEV